MATNTVGLRGMALGIVGLTLGACSQSDSASLTGLSAVEATTAMSGTGTASAGLLAAVRAATARFHATAQATKAGYAEDPVCVEVPGLGGMGHHWVNGALVDATFEPTQPEAILYAPDKNGKMKLVAVEYLVLNTGQTAPTFDGQAFDVGGAPIQAPHWTLHVWLYEPNPSGTFAPFNPNVDCP